VLIGSALSGSGEELMVPQATPPSGVRG